MKTEIFNINYIVNANAIEMVDGSKWINWMLNLRRKGLNLKSCNRIAQQLTE